jgi:hypothetical protein
MLIGMLIGSLANLLEDHALFGGLKNLVAARHQQPAGHGHHPFRAGRQRPHVSDAGSPMNRLSFPGVQSNAHFTEPREVPIKGGAVLGLAFSEHNI